MIFESHAHYDDARFDEDREALLKQIKQSGVEYIVNIGADMNSSRASIELAKTHSFMYTCVGVHPEAVSEMNEESISILEAMTDYEKVVGIGEIGLDYYYDTSPKETQRYWFKLQLELAKKVQLPIVIHSREASKETYDMLMEADLDFNEKQPAGVIHCYSGHKEMAWDYIRHGYMIGVGGILTFKNAKKLVEVVESIPIENIVVETDSPYLAPVPNRGKRNDSTNLTYIISKIAELKDMTPQEVEQITYENGKKLFFREG